MSKHSIPASTTSQGQEPPAKKSRNDSISDKPSVNGSGIKGPEFNPRYKDPPFVDSFFKAFSGRTSFKDDNDSDGSSNNDNNTKLSGAQVFSVPYPTAALPDFLTSPSYVQSLRDELLEETYYHKSNDLYEFYQSEDLKVSKKPHIVALKEAIYSKEFFAMMSSLTGIDLNPNVIDLNGNQYHEGCFLLCHDDDIKTQIEGRRIAFILYLVDEDWSAADGGALDLFACNESGQPSRIVESLVPVRNTLAFFELSSASYHQVAEVLSKTKSRVSISGWFHGPLQTKLVSKTSLFKPFSEVSTDDALLEELINPEYRTKAAIKSIFDIFLDQSSIELQKFFRPEIYDQLCKELQKIDPKGGSEQLWDQALGPMHVRTYRRISETNRDQIPATLKKIQKMFQSTAFKNYLKEITHLGLLSAFQEVRMFKQGDYTMLHDYALEKNGLDVMFSFPRFVPGSEDQEWNESWNAGATHYVAGKSNLLTLLPKHNTLTAVLRDEGTLRFVRFLSSKVKGAQRREVSVLYTVDEDEEDEEGDDEDSDDDDAMDTGK